MGSGHFLEVLAGRLLQQLDEEQGVPREEAYRQVVSAQLLGADVDPFALSLAAIRLFLLVDEDDTAPGLSSSFTTCSCTRERKALFTEAESVTGIDADVDEPGDVDAAEFDAVVGNPLGRGSPSTSRRCTAACTASCRRS